MLQEGDISAHQHSTFFTAAKEFLTRCTEYLLQWCPFKEELLVHATWLDFENRLEASFLSVEYFVHMFPHVLHNVNMELLNEQFIQYQTLLPEEIPIGVKESAGLAEDDYHQVDVLWGYLRQLKNPGTNIYFFDLLFQVAEVIMTIPHSNAGEERIFSLINKNKTSSRSSLKLDGTLSSLITVKAYIKDPLQWNPSSNLLQ